jgi:hypothetical protein
MAAALHNNHFIFVKWMSGFNRQIERTPENDEKCSQSPPHPSDFEKQIMEILYFKTSFSGFSTTSH